MIRVVFSTLVCIAIIIRWTCATAVVIGLYLRNPLDLKLTRSRAWLLARADRLHKKLSEKKRAQLEEFIERGILRYTRKVGRPVKSGEGLLIEWGPGYPVLA